MASETNIHWLCFQAVQRRILSLGLAGIDAANVVIVKLPLPDRAKAEGVITGFPAILLSPFGQETMNPLAGTNLRDDVGYPVVVTIVAADNQQSLTANMATYLLWRRRIAMAFRNSRLDSTVPEVINVTVEPLMIALPAAWTMNFWHSSLVVRCLSREDRGTNAIGTEDGLLLQTEDDKYVTQEVGD